MKFEEPARSPVQAAPGVPAPAQDEAATAGLALLDGLARALAAGPSGGAQAEALGRQLGLAVAHSGDGSAGVLARWQSLRRDLPPRLPGRAPPPGEEAPGQRFMEAVLAQALAVHQSELAGRQRRAIAQLQHDLRVPLNVLQLICEVLDRKPESATPQHLAALGRNVQRLVDLVDTAAHPD